MRALTQLRTDERGSVAIVFALLVTTLFGFMALAVDMGRAYNVQTRVAHALDAAALAGAKALDGGANDEEIRLQANIFFDSTLQDLRTGAIIERPIAVQIDRATVNVVASANVSLATTFGRVLGVDRINLDRASTVNVRTRYVELAMALDTTGSMNSDNKLNDLKSAAKEIVKILFDGSRGEDLVRISLVPWAASVNAGPYAAGVSNYASTDQCVVERTGANEATDAGPIGPDSVRAITTSPYGYNCPTSPVVPLSGRSRESDLNNAIDAMTGNGATGGHIGTAWGWYTLSPAWTSVWPAPNRPRPYAPSSTVKNVLIMSDGEFNVAWKTSEIYDPTSMGEESYASFQTLCTNMKAQQINVYTIGFGLTNARAIAELGTCATSNSQFYNTASGTELKKAFRDIAAQIKAMRITN